MKNFLDIFTLKTKSIYFYKNKIIKINKDNENRDIYTYSKKKLIFILYSAEIIDENYLDSSEELEGIEIKKSCKKQTKGKKDKKKTKSNIKKRRLDEEEIDEESQESESDKDNEDIKKI